VVNDGAENADGQLRPLTLAGLGLNLGIGVEYYVTPAFSFMGGAYKRWASFDQYKGWGSQYTVLTQYGEPKNDDGGGFLFVVGTTLGVN
jgi:hypothetical protein